MLVAIENDPSSEHTKRAIRHFEGHLLINDVKNIPENITLAVGSIDFIISTLIHLGRDVPKVNHYPTELNKYLGRNIQLLRRDDIFKLINSGHGPLFIKDANQWKSNDTKFIVDVYDMIYVSKTKKYYVSEVMDFKQECRVYVKNNQIVDIKKYMGIGDIPLIDVQTAEKAASESKSSTCALDFGLTTDGETFLIEHNDAFALGNYGLSDEVYFNLLQTKWDELTM